MKKDFKQYQRDLQSGLDSINNVIKTTMDRKKYEKAKKNKNVQEARIDFFKRGYNIAYKEIRDQKKIPCKLPVKEETGIQTTIENI